MKDKVLLGGKLIEYKETWENLMEIDGSDGMWWNMMEYVDCGL